MLIELKNYIGVWLPAIEAIPKMLSRVSTFWHDQTSKKFNNLIQVIADIPFQSIKQR